jgi:hypothetical protein
VIGQCQSLCLKGFCALRHLICCCFRSDGPYESYAPWGEATDATAESAASFKTKGADAVPDVPDYPTSEKKDAPIWKARL